MTVVFQMFSKQAASLEGTYRDLYTINLPAFVKKKSKGSFTLEFVLPNVLFYKFPDLPEMPYWKHRLPPTHVCSQWEISYCLRLKPIHDSNFGTPLQSQPIPIEFVQIGRSMWPAGVPLDAMLAQV